VPVDRQKWPKRISESGFPKWPCPYCGHTVAVRKDGIRAEETGASRAAHDHPVWEPDWINGRFIAECRCSNCSDPATILGTYTLVEIPDVSWQQQEYVARYEITAIDPPPALIRVPPDLPDEIGAQLDKAFVQFWIDEAACANAIRGLVEEYLDYSRIRKTDGSRSRRGRLTLHKRIELFSTKDKHLGEALMAVKWIGNVGSHAQEISRDALFDGFDIVEQVLEETFASPRRHVARLSKAIVRRKGPRK
jgi:hypothetical protein